MATKGGRSSKGKDKGSGPGWRDSMAPAAIIIGVAVAFGGLIAANQAGVFDTVGGGDPCASVEGGNVVHEHATIYVYLDSETPYDFSPRKYQVAASFIHFEHGIQDRNGAQVHIHQTRPTLACLFDTLNWRVGPDGITTDTGEHYPVDEDHEIEVLFNGEPSDKGFQTELHGCSGPCNTYVIRYKTVDGGSDGTDGSDTGNQTGNQTLVRSDL